MLEGEICIIKNNLVINDYLPCFPILVFDTYTHIHTQQNQYLQQ